MQSKPEPRLQAAAVMTCVTGCYQMHNKNIMIYPMAVYTRFKAGQIFWSRGTIDSTIIRLQAERHGVRIPKRPKPIPFSKTFRPGLESIDLLPRGKASQV